MSVAYRCNFADSAVEYTEALGRISRVFRECNVEFREGIARIESNLSADVSFYAIDGHDLQHGLEVDSMDAAIATAAGWSGAAFYCAWRDVLDDVDDAVMCELDFYVARTEAGCRVAFEEERVLNDIRAEEPSLEANFYRFLVSLCQQLEVCCCVYGNETTLENLLVNERVVEEILENGVLPDGSTPGTVVFRAAQQTWSSRQAFVQRYARELVLSSAGYGILKLEKLE